MVFCCVDGGIHKQLEHPFLYSKRNEKSKYLQAPNGAETQLEENITMKEDD